MAPQIFVKNKTVNFSTAQKYIASLSHQTKRLYLPNASDCSWYLLRLQFLLNLLKNPEQTIPHYIHITGTSGKGSTAIMLANILEKSNRGKIGLLTSPGLTGTLDRVSVNGVNMTNTEFTHYVAKIKKLIPLYKKTSPYDIPSEFELLTAIAFLHFAAKKVTWAVVEAGLGGRYDSTNVIPHKDVAIITNIGHDHLDLIGPTLSDVAYEKAGIIKPGAVVFTGEQNPALIKIIEKECQKNKTSLKIFNHKYLISNKITNSNKINFKNIFLYKNKSYTLNVLGYHQIQNAILAIDVAHALKISPRAISLGLATARFPIRFEVVSKKPLTILDGAHNFEKMQSTVATITQLTTTPYSPPPTHLVISFSADKQIAPMLKLLATLHPTTVACTKFTLNTKRVPISPSNLAKLAKKYFPYASIKPIQNPKSALKWAQKQQKSRTLLITGSMYLAGELRLQFDI